MTRKQELPAESTPAGRLDEAQLHQVLGYQMAQASIVTDGVFTEEVGKPFDLRPVEYTILSLIDENPGGSPARLAQALAVSAPNITTWIDRLEQRGLVVREPSVTDRRSQHLKTTPKGSRLARQATRRLLDAERQTLDRLTPGERGLLIELLHKIAGQRRK
jgi:DNA-binding MarR family transcriptional regulator